VVTATATSGLSVGVGGAATASVVSVAPPAPPTPEQPAPDEQWFNGIWWPRVHLLFGLNGTLDPGAQYLHLGVSPPGLGTGLLAGTTWVGPQNGKDIRSVSITGRGRDGPIDSATPATLTVVLNNSSGDYDPDNPSSPYAIAPQAGTDLQPTLNYTQAGGPSSSGCTNSKVTLVSGGSLQDMGGAAATTPNGTSPATPAQAYTFWQDLPGGYNQVRWQVRPDLDTQTANAGYFWALQGNLRNAAGTGTGSVWYAGLQSRAPNPKGIIFSIWEGIGGVAGDIPGTVSQAFTGEGEGWQLLADYNWTAGRTYSLRVVADTARGPRWYAAYFTDTTTGIQTWLGSIRAATIDGSELAGVAYQWTELFSQVTPATTCPLLPRSTTFFSIPTFTTAAPSGPSGLDVGTPIDLRAERPLGTIWRRFYGEITSITLDAGDDPTVTIVAADGLEKLGRTQLTGRTIPVGDGDRSGTRINRILDEAGYPTVLRSVDTGQTIVAPTVFGDFALELLRQVEMTEFGFLWVDGGGMLRFYDRHKATTTPRSTTSQVTFSDADAPAEAILVELELDWSRDRTFNDAHVTRDPTPGMPTRVEDPDAADDTPVEQVWTDLATQSQWGTLSVPAEVGKLLRSDFEAYAMAQYLVERFKTSQARVRKVKVNLLRRTDLWDRLLPLGLLDRIAVRRNYGPRTIVEQLLIQGFSETITSDPPGWEIELDTALPPPTPSRFILGSSLLGSGKPGW